MEDIRATRFTSDAFRPTAQLLTMAVPSLAAPVSQPCTAEQMREAAWHHWTAELAWSPGPDPSRWPEVFALQALRLHNMLQPGTRGTLIGMHERMTALAQARGCELAADDEFSDVAGMPPADFLCSAAPLHVGAAASPVAEVEAVLRRVRLGGLAIIFLPLRGAGTLHGLSRTDLERLALLLISRRHEVAQIAPGRTVVPDRAGPAAFGLMVRRAGSVF